MISWVAALPWLALPSVLFFVAGLLPNVSLYGQQVGGGLVRQWFINHVLLPYLPRQDAAALLDWYMHTDVFGELLLHGLIGLNFNALILPFLYMVFSGFIAVNNWAVKTDLDQKRRSAKQ